MPTSCANKIFTINYYMYGYFCITKSRNMIIKVLAFGITKDIFGASSAEVEVDDETVTVNSLKTLLQQRYPRLQKLSSYMIAVNNDYGSGEDVIHANDEIAVIPPVSGG